MKSFRETFPDKPSGSLEERLATAHLYSAKYFSDEDFVDKRVEIFRFSENREKEKVQTGYLIVKVSYNGENEVEFCDSCPIHKKETIQKLAQYLPEEILNAELGKPSKEKYNFPISSIGIYSEEEGKIFRTYYFQDGTIRRQETIIEKILPKEELPEERIESKVLESMLRARQEPHPTDTSKKCPDKTYPPKTIPKEKFNVTTQINPSKYSQDLSDKGPTIDTPKSQDED